MNLWLWLAAAWLGAGGIAVLTVEHGARESRVPGPLSQPRWLNAVGYSAAVIAGVPLLLLFALTVSGVTIWQGQIPLLGRPWSIARAAKFEPPASRETILAQMIDLRQRYDPRLSKRRSASNWPMRELWEEPEAVILEITEQYHWQLDGGLTEEDALDKLHLSYAGESSVGLGQGATLLSCISSCLAIRYPLYVGLGRGLLDRSIGLCQRWVQEDMERQASSASFPPREWFKKRVTLEEARSAWSISIAQDNTVDGLASRPDVASGVGFRESWDWKRLRLRMVPSDEIWTFASPAGSWDQMCGRAGVALVRDGRAILHIIMMMN